MRAYFKNMIQAYRGTSPGGAIKLSPGWKPWVSENRLLFG